MKDRRIPQPVWKKLVTKAEYIRRCRIENLLSRRSKIQREMSACKNLHTKRYQELLKKLRENAAKLSRIQTHE